MKTIPLSRLLNKREIQDLLHQVGGCGSAAGGTIGIADMEGRWLAAEPTPPTDMAPILQTTQTLQPIHTDQLHTWPLIIEEAGYGVLYCTFQYQHLGHVLYPLLCTLIQKELTQKVLAQETLDRYREINLLYRIHETIGASLDLADVIHRVLEESIRIIKADGGAVLLADKAGQALTVFDSIGPDVAEAEQSLIGQSLSRKVFETGKSRILNDLDAFVRPDQGEQMQLCALLAAPFKFKESVLGVITLARTRSGAMFTAGDDKLLTALASQASVAIANAQQVQERERELRQQIQALRIEIDEVKKQQEVAFITESEFFRSLQENAQRMRDEFALD